MSSVNKATILGNLGRDPETRSMQDGTQIVSLSVATSQTWKDKNTGERREATEWHRVVIFNEGLGKIAVQYLRKGSKVYLEGEIKTRKWQDQGGQDRYSTEIVLGRFGGALVLLDGRQDGGEERQTTGDGSLGGYQPGKAGPLDDLDSIPF
ncbi:single-stranded DNA-binding protein [Zavarzinia compransoris]|uniref:single-stranded DNA-binding protein n=1 Tax=Zavarzinia marina TaxID=2911065 RepID=UPI001F2FB24A|nr:single-stranded DNA-binding protein [Zavarzinia marina]MCF4166370.1 single-stranded DNA-binding protein [Zavarzinia marina]